MKKGIIFLVVLLLAGGAFLYFGGDLSMGQGRLSLAGGTRCAVTLSAGSPSGTRTISSNDTILKFDISSLKKPCVARPNKGFVKVTISSNGSLNLGADGDTALLKTGAHLVADGLIYVKNADLAIMKFNAPSTGIRIAPGVTKQYEVRLSTVDLLTTSAGSDELITATARFGGAKVVGNTLVY